MNKFVKGAKNLAFALSFVTVAACGYVKKADLEALDKKINDKFKGIADNGTVDEGQGYVRRSDVDSKIASEKKVLVEEIAGIKGKMATRENIIDICIKKGGVDFELLKRCGVDLEGRNFSVSFVGSKVVIKSGDVVVVENFEVNSFADVEFIKNVLSLKGSFVFDKTFDDSNRLKISAGTGDNQVKVGKYEGANAADTVNLICLLGEIGKETFEKFFDRGAAGSLGASGALGEENKKIFKQVFTGIAGVLGADEEMKKRFGAGLEVLCGMEGVFMIGKSGGTADEAKVSDGKLGFVFKKKVGNIAAIDLQS